MALFGITNDGLNLAVNLLLLFLAVIWLALIYWTFSDARRRIEDPMLVGCATAASLFPLIGSVVYMIVRPPEYLADARERELEIAAAQARLASSEQLACPYCDADVEKSFLRCPSCTRKLRDPCANCSRPLDPRWQLCPYCEAAVGQRPRRRRPAAQEAPAAAPAARRPRPAEAPRTQTTPEAPRPQRTAQPRPVAPPTGARPAARPAVPGRAASRPQAPDGRTAPRPPAPDGRPARPSRPSPEPDPSRRARPRPSDRPGVRPAPPDPSEEGAGAPARPAPPPATRAAGRERPR